MNFYEHHLGDYMRDTAHLSMIEDAAYRRLLDAYYIREAPLPAATAISRSADRSTPWPARNEHPYAGSCRETPNREASGCSATASRHPSLLLPRSRLRIEPRGFARLVQRVFSILFGLRKQHDLEARQASARSSASATASPTTSRPNSCNTCCDPIRSLTSTHLTPRRPTMTIADDVDAQTRRLFTAVYTAAVNDG